MKRWLYAHRIVSGSPVELEERLRQGIGELLCRATGGPGTEVAADGSFTLALSSTITGLRVGKTVRVTTGVATRSGDRVRIPVSWRAEPARVAFPTFEGTVEFEPHSRSSGQISLVGVYRPPLGPAGAAVDAMGLRHAAERTAQWLVDGLARALTGKPAAHSRTADGPGGRGLVVRDVMTPDPLVLDESLPLRTAALLLFHYEVGGAPVVAGDGSLVGVLSEADLLEKEASARPGITRAAAESERRRRATTVGDACSRPALVTAADASLRSVARVMGDERVARLVVVDESRVAGIITRHDVLRALIRSDAEIGAAIDVLLDDLGEPRLAARIEWGVVRLEGTVELRSSIPRIVALVEAVDGVIDVDESNVSWTHDDIVPVGAYTHQL